MNRDFDFMLEAINLAKKGWYTTSPNPRVGCVIVKDDKIIARGWHERAGGPHAEVHALKQAGNNAKGATVYVTLEPCSHTGRTPPCCDALIKAEVGRVVVAMQDPNPQVAGQGIERLYQAGIATQVGILEAQARALNEGFFKRMLSKMPMIRAKMGASLDARTAMANGESQWITSSASRQDVQRLRAQSCAIMTGIGTILADDPSLNVRSEPYVDYNRAPARVILDSQLRIPIAAKCLQLDGDVHLFCEQGQQQSDKAKQLQDKGAKVHGIAKHAGQLDLKHIVLQLAQLEFNEVLLETGPSLAGNMLNAGLVDEIYLYLAPKLLGHDAKALFQLNGLEHLSDAIELEFSDVRRIGSDLRLCLKPLS